MPWSTEEMLDGQHQRVDIPAHARAAYKGLLQKRLEEDLCWIVPYVPPTTALVKELNWTELNCGLVMQRIMKSKHFCVIWHYFHCFHKNLFIPKLSFVCLCVCEYWSKCLSFHGWDLMGHGWILGIRCLSESSKDGFEMHFECDVSVLRIQTLNWSYPCHSHLSTPHVVNFCRMWYWISFFLLPPRPKEMWRSGSWVASPDWSGLFCQCHQRGRWNGFPSFSMLHPLFQFWDWFIYL